MLRVELSNFGNEFSNPSTSKQPVKSSWALFVVRHEQSFLHPPVNFPTSHEKHKFKCYFRSCSFSRHTLLTHMFAEGFINDVMFDRVEGWKGGRVELQIASCFDLCAFCYCSELWCYRTTEFLTNLSNKVAEFGLLYCWLMSSLFEQKKKSLRRKSIKTIWFLFTVFNLFPDYDWRHFAHEDDKKAHKKVKT